MLIRNTALFILFCLCCAFKSFAQQRDTTISAEDMAKKRQDPVAGLKSIYLQEVMIPVGDGNAHSLSIQPVWPFRIAKNLKLITYTIIPLQTFPAINPGDSRQSGLGNILFNGYFSTIEKKGHLSWGIGPAVQLPTRTNATLGSNRVSLGPSALLYYSTDKLSGGLVAQNFWSLGGGDGSNKVNTFSLQYIAFYNLPKAWFLLSNATISANWEAAHNSVWLVPLGAGTGKTFKIGSQSKLFYCITGQAMYNAVRPDYVGSWQAIIQFQVIL